MHTKGGDTIPPRRGGSLPLRALLFLVHVVYASALLARSVIIKVTELWEIARALSYSLARPYTEISTRPSVTFSAWSADADDNNVGFDLADSAASAGESFSDVTKPLVGSLSKQKQRERARRLYLKLRDPSLLTPLERCELLEKRPQHVGFSFNSDQLTLKYGSPFQISPFAVEQVSNLICWCASLQITSITLFDTRGVLARHFEPIAEFLSRSHLKPHTPITLCASQANPLPEKSSKPSPNSESLTATYTSFPNAQTPSASASGGGGSPLHRDPSFDPRWKHVSITSNGMGRVEEASPARPFLANPEEPSQSTSEEFDRLTVYLLSSADSKCAVTRSIRKLCHRVRSPHADDGSPRGHDSSSSGDAGGLVASLRSNRHVLFRNIRASYGWIPEPQLVIGVNDASSVRGFPPYLLRLAELGWITSLSDLNQQSMFEIFSDFNESEQRLGK